MPISDVNLRSIALLSAGSVVAGYIVYKLFSRSRTDFADVFPVRVCNNLADWVASEAKFLKVFTEAKFIGLDCEWVTVNEHRNPVSLLQLATADGFCVLVRLCHISPWLMPSGLTHILNDSNIIKVGVGIFDDAKKLLQDYGLTVNGCLDLRQIVKNHKDFQGKGLSLQVLAEYFLDAKLKKDISLSCSDWESERLDPNQIAYAAEDALAAAQIYETILEGENAKFLDDNKKKELLIDVPYKHINQKKTSGVTKPQNTPAKTIRYNKILTRSRIMYENCQLQAPDGEPLCSCDRKKAQWYVEKGRATVIKEKPFTVRLNFEPSGRPILDNKYYIQAKENCCVVCGQTKFFFRKSVVPSEYRRYFPNLMKRNLSHDVLLLCVACHRKSNVLDQRLRQQLAKECNAPIEIGKGLKVKTNQELAIVKSAAKALLQSNDKIPEKRKEELKKVVCKHFKTDNVTEEQLKEASRFLTCTVNDNYVPHGWKVFQHVTKNGGLIQFESRWRKHFLDSMQPKFLPTMWSVDHNHERLALQVVRNKADFDISILGLSPELIEKVKKLKC